MGSGVAGLIQGHLSPEGIHLATSPFVPSVNQYTLSLDIGAERKKTFAATSWGMLDYGESGLTVKNKQNESKIHQCGFPECTCSKGDGNDSKHDAYYVVRKQCYSPSQ